MSPSPFAYSVVVKTSILVLKIKFFTACKIILYFQQLNININIDMRKVNIKYRENINRCHSIFKIF